MGIKIVPHPPYCPDFSPCDFWLLTIIWLWDNCVTKVIDKLTEEDFHVAFQMLLERHNKCIATGGDYFEGD